MKRLCSLGVALACALGAGCVTATRDHEQQGGIMAWQEHVTRLLPLFGHRNWILVVDKAFPLQSAKGVTVVDTQTALPEVLARVLHAVQAAKHVKPVLYTDSELAHVTEDLAPGIDALRAAVTPVLADREVRILPHETVFAKLDQASALFQVLVLKTECTLPYTSVFIELDCGYWSSEKEQTLRERMR